MFTGRPEQVEEELLVLLEPLSNNLAIKSNECLDYISVHQSNKNPTYPPTVRPKKCSGTSQHTNIGELCKEYRHNTPLQEKNEEHPPTHIKKKKKKKKLQHRMNAKMIVLQG